MIEPSLMFGTELLFTVIAVIFCFLIYFKTKESYELTRHEGINYFRNAFLFLGFSYVLRFLWGIMMISRTTFEFIMPREMFAFLFILPLGYFSTISIFYLIHGSVWKNSDDKKFLILSHGIAILLSVISFITRSPLILLCLQCALLCIVLLLNFAKPHKKTKISQIKVLYILIAALWLINLLVIDQMRPLPLEISILFQITSLAVFAVIYHKILKWVK